MDANLQATKAADKLALYKNLKQIAENIYAGAGVSHIHPIDQE